MEIFWDAKQIQGIAPLRDIHRIDAKNNTGTCASMHLPSTTKINRTRTDHFHLLKATEMSAVSEQRASTTNATTERTPSFSCTPEQRPAQGVRPPQACMQKTMKFGLSSTDIYAQRAITHCLTLLYCTCCGGLAQSIVRSHVIDCQSTRILIQQTGVVLMVCPLGKTKV